MSIANIITLHFSGLSHRPPIVHFDKYCDEELTVPGSRVYIMHVTFLLFQSDRMLLIQTIWRRCNDRPARPHQWQPPLYKPSANYSYVSPLHCPRPLHYQQTSLLETVFYKWHERTAFTLQEPAPANNPLIPYSLSPLASCLKDLNLIECISTLLNFLCYPVRIRKIQKLF